VFCANDVLALGAVNAARGLGLDVPGDVSVVGFDDIPSASLTNPPLTTVAQDTRRAGEALVDTLLRLVSDEHAEGMVLPTKLIVRRSCGATLPAAVPAMPAGPH